MAYPLRNLDLSVNKPAIPLVGANFAASGPYASYVLVGTVATDDNRIHIDIENISGAQIALVLDDGTAAPGSAPNNATVFSLAGGASAGAQGGSWSASAPRAFHGRIQIYAASASAAVSVFAWYS